MPNRTATLHRKRQRPPRASKDAGAKVHPTDSPASSGNSLANDTNFELLFSKNPHPMYVIDRQTLRFLEVNAAAIEQYGFSREEFLAMSVTEIRPSEDIPRVLESIRGHDGPVAPKGHWRHSRKDGRLFDVQITGQSIPFAGHDAILVVAQDISARKAAEEKVAEHTAYLQALTENNPLGIVTVDAQHRIQMCNPIFERLFGYSLDEIRGQH